MLSFDRRIFLLGLTSVAGCGFEPVYGTGGSATPLRSAVLVAAPVTEEQFFFVERLEEKLGRPQAPVYELKFDLSFNEEGLAVTGSNDITRYNVVGEVKYQLFDMTTGQKKVSNTLNTFTSYSASLQPVATLEAERAATQRLMTGLADKIVSDLLLKSEQL